MNRRQLISGLMATSAVAAFSGIQESYGSIYFDDKLHAATNFGKYGANPLLHSIFDQLRPDFSETLEASYVKQLRHIAETAFTRGPSRVCFHNEKQIYSLHWEYCIRVAGAKKRAIQTYIDNLMENGANAPFPPLHSEIEFIDYSQWKYPYE